MAILEQASNIAHALRNNKLDVKDVCEVIDIYETLLGCVGYIQAIAENENIDFIKSGQYHVDLPEVYRKEYMMND